MFIPWLVIEIIGIAALFSNSIVYFVLANDYAKQLEVSPGVVMIAGYIFDLILSKLIFCKGNNNVKCSYSKLTINRTDFFNKILLLLQQLENIFAKQFLQFIFWHRYVANNILSLI